MTDASRMFMRRRKKPPTWLDMEPGWTLPPGTPVTPAMVQDSITHPLQHQGSGTSPDAQKPAPAIPGRAPKEVYEDQSRA